ncbi:uncharacterized protein LOC112348290 [Selaginella moellendorffii]|uniref:uncharacterized protein LOC112348290 n=1 Tax=Selaginella moellendorffii TaxID=88036 RepID=UPI000D1C3D2A|nr:uncharacterized protein LOC112348290 [Selaginella moellendorffii]|eukprot:XP_024536292.1 uncharacterized protein LOC112348290 [Selaginella moellendorffii]
MAEEPRKLNPEDLWRWFGEFHWQHWHGIWINWRVSDSLEIARTYRSIRSFQSRAADGSVVFHRNDWYDPAGASERKMTPKSWLINRQEHCGADGIIHPAVPNSRTLVFPNGDLAWLGLDIDFPQRPVVGEVFFMLPGKNARVAIIVSYNTDGSLSASQILEESRDTDDRPEDSWRGSVWNHDLATVALESKREEPAGEFVGEETTLYPTGLVLATRKPAIWRGFKPDCDDSTLIHMPYGFTACVPEKVKLGEEFSCAVHWVVSEREVRNISWKFSAQGKLEHFRTAKFSVLP